VTVDPTAPTLPGDDPADGLVHAYLLDRPDRRTPLGWDEIRAWTPDQGTLWVHLDRLGSKAQAWLRDESGIDDVHVEALLEPDIRPRFESAGDAVLLALRGVNLNPGAEPEDMIALRLWLEERRVITLRHRWVMAVSDVRQAIDAGTGPAGADAFLAEISDRLIERMAPILARIDDGIDGLEDRMVRAQAASMRSELASQRRLAIMLRRYLAPQRDVMARLSAEPIGWLSPTARAKLRQVADHVTRYVEDLDAARDRAQVIQDELNNRLADRLNRNMYLLTIVASVLLPPSFVTGLLGMNVGGMPMFEWPWGFAVVSVMIAAIAAVEVWLLKRLGWI